IDNYAVIAGSVDLGAGTNALNIMNSGVLYAGSAVNVGEGNLVSNAGRFSPGGSQQLMRTVLTGNYRQSSSGLMQIDFDLAHNRSDQVVVSGDAVMQGRVQVGLVNAGRARPGSRESVFVDAGGLLTTDGLVVVPSRSPVASYHLEPAADQAMALNVDVNFAPYGLRGNERVMGDFFNRLQSRGGSPLMAPYVEALFEVDGIEQLGRTYRSFMPGSYRGYSDATCQVALQPFQAFSSRMNGIRKTAVFRPLALDSLDTKYMIASTDRYAGLDHALSLYQWQFQQGVWVKATGLKGTQYGRDGFPGFDYYNKGVSGGIDLAAGENLLLGLGLSYSLTNVDADDSENHGKIDSRYLVLYSSYSKGNWYADLSLSKGFHNYESTRSYQLFDTVYEAESKHSGDSWSASSEFGYIALFGNWVVQPYVGMNYTLLDETGFSETGAGALNLDVGSRSTRSMESTIGVSVSREYLFGRYRFIPEVHAAWEYDFDLDDDTSTASFAGVSDDSFSIVSPGKSRHTLNVGAGLNFIAETGAGLSLRYQQNLRSESRESEFTGEIRIPF
ncbi:MAG: autotransporter domain-containing protein, partial [Chlorobiaceae bacterium]|nr:autotransporter domain-containing protein [Chlorobiaceae bacterium]